MPSDPTPLTEAGLAELRRNTLRDRIQEAIHDLDSRQAMAEAGGYSFGGGWRQWSPLDIAEDIARQVAPTLETRLLDHPAPDGRIAALMRALRDLVGDHDVHPAFMPDCSICVALYPVAASPDHPAHPTPEPDIEALTNLLRTPCDCGPAWTERGRHDPRCFYQFVHDYLDDDDIAAILDDYRATPTGETEATR
jgi:hypothetical protein